MAEESPSLILLFSSSICLNPIQILGLRPSSVKAHFEAMFRSDSDNTKPYSGTPTRREIMNGVKNADGESERTAFRKAEKKYKLYYLHGSSKKKKVPKPVDLSEVIDFEAVRESYERESELPVGIAAVKCEFGRTAFWLNDRPGFYFIPGALSLQEQGRWIRESLISFPQPPNRTNHNVEYGPINDLFVTAKERQVLVEDKSLLQSGVPTSESHAANGSGFHWKFVDEPEVKATAKGQKYVAASVLLRKLRWSTLGIQFNWSQRNYDISLPHNKIPDDLCQLAIRMATPAMGAGEQFKPEAAIVNYFGLGDTLGGHLDDMEADWSKPIVSLSLGCKAIFLLGGKTRDEPPLAMFLRSGDVVLMAGEARECFHGVPRIFTDEDAANKALLEQQFSEPEDHCFLEYIKASRININIRQVF